jgi:hypothetical protein
VRASEFPAARILEDRKEWVVTEAIFIERRESGSAQAHPIDNHTKSAIIFLFAALI